MCMNVWVLEVSSKVWDATGSPHVIAKNCCDLIRSDTAEVGHFVFLCQRLAFDSCSALLSLLDRCLGVYSDPTYTVN